MLDDDMFVSDHFASIETAQSAASERVAAVEDELFDLLSATESDISALENKDASLASATTALSTRVSATESDISALENNASATTALSTRVFYVERDVTALETKDIALASATTALSTRVSSVEASLRSLTSKVAYIEAGYVDLRKTHLLKNHETGYYMNASGTPTTVAWDHRAHYSIEHDDNN